MKILNLYEDKKVWLTNKGYPSVWRDGKSKMVHVLEWEKHNGPKPEGMQIHHLDENKANWEISNLLLVSASDHLKIHAGWVSENGVWVAKPCKDCTRLLPLDCFHQRKGLTPLHYCIDCGKKRHTKRNTAEYRLLRKKYMRGYYSKNKHAKWGIKV